MAGREERVEDKDNGKCFNFISYPEPAHPLCNSRYCPREEEVQTTYNGTVHTEQPRGGAGRGNSCSSPWCSLSKFSHLF